MRRLVALLFFVGLLLCARESFAYPFLSLRPGGTPFEGPTDPEISSIFWNPAALSEMRGFHVGATGQLVLQRGSIARTPICSTTGLPTNSATAGACAGTVMSFPSSSVTGTYGTGLGGLSWDFGTQNVVVALGSYAPWESHTQMGGGIALPGSAGSPNAYHLNSEDFSTVYTALALAFKISRSFHVGVSIALADSSAALDFDRDSALEAHGCAAGTSASSCAPNTWTGGSATVGKTGYENPSYAERIRVRGDGGTFLGPLPSPTGLSIALGILYRPTDRVVLGVSWSHMFSVFGNLGRYASGGVASASVTPSVAAGSPCGTAGIAGSDGNCHGGDLIEYDVPDIWSLGARFRLTPKLELSTWARLVIYGGYSGSSASQQALVVHLSGDPVDKGNLPERIVLGRGLQPSFAYEIGLRYRPVSSLRIGASLIAETNAVPSAYVDAEALDAPKLDGMFALEWRLARYFRVTVGYELTGYFFAANSGSAYDPSATVRCVDARYDLNSCAVPLAGAGLPSAQGAYTLLDHRFSLGAGFDF